MAEIDDIFEEVALATRLLFEMDLATGPTIERGHVSYRLPNQPDTFMIKGIGPALSLVRAEDIVIVDMNGYKAGGPKTMNLPSEVKMHSCILRDHPEVNSVVHVHPRYSVLMSVLQQDLGPMCIEGMGMVATPLPMFPHPRLIVQDDDGTEVARLIGDRDAILLQGHGAATVGKDMEDSIMNMLLLEEQARMNYLAFCAAGAGHSTITNEQREDFVANARRPRQDDHLKPEVAPTNRKPGGVWVHYAELASRRLS